MPYKLRKAPNRNLYWVVSKDGKHMSKEPIPKERASAQMRALYANERKEGGVSMEEVSTEAHDAIERAKSYYQKSTPNTKAQYEKRANAMRKNNERLIKLGQNPPPVPTYEEYLADFQSKESNREKNIDMTNQELENVIPELMKPYSDDSKSTLPDLNTLQQIAEASYSPTPPQKIGNFELVQATLTLKFYKDDASRTIIVGIRGTKPSDAGDLKADALIALNKMETSARFKTDLSELLNFQNEYPRSSFNYYGVGHSLGGAILDSFLKKQLLKKGVSYNPAVQPMDFDADIPNHRIYHKGDALYAIMGKRTKGAEVRNGKDKKKSVFESLVGWVPGIGQAYNYYANHNLSNFEGGRLCKGCKSLVMRGGMNLTEATCVTGSCAGIGALIGFITDVATHNPSQMGLYLGSALGTNIGLGIVGANAISNRIRRRDINQLTVRPTDDMEPVLVQRNPLRHAPFGRQQTALRDVMGIAPPEPVQPPSHLHIENPDGSHSLATLSGHGAYNAQSKFQKQLAKAKVSPKEYLNVARQKAKHKGLAYKHLGFSDDKKHKLQIPNESGKMVRFGSVGLGDHILYTLSGDASASKHRKAYLARATKIKGDWKDDDYSANNLAINVLW